MNEKEDYQIDSTINIFINLTGIRNIIDYLIGEFRCDDINSRTDKKIIEKNTAVILTSTQTQKDNEDKNNITMNLCECENILKKSYNIPEENSLYMIQIIYEEKGMKIPKVEYEVYYPLHNCNNLEKLDLALCKGTKIEISTPVKINDSLDKYNLSSNYYNDICSKTTSESGTDISLNDRRNEFINNNMTLCEENCSLIEYNYTKEKAKCSCDIKISVPLDFDIKFKKSDFFKSFVDVKNIFNIGILKCYKTVLKIKSLKKNYGSFIIASIILLYFITLIIFIAKSFDKLKKEINKILFALKFRKFSGTPIKNEKNRIIKNKPLIILYIKKYVLNKKENIKEKKDKNIFIKNNRNESYNERSKKLYFTNYKKKGIRPEKFNNNNNEIDSCSKLNVINKIKKGDNKLNNKKKIMEIKEFELSSLDYINAIKLDHRNYFQYYISSLKYNHPILFSFGGYDDYNSNIIKFFLFFFSLCLDLTINALFFTDDTMHKIYQDRGKFDFIYQIPQILYSTIISKFIDALIKNLSLTQDDFIRLKQRKNIKNIEQERKKVLRVIKIKFIIFFVLAFLILIFCWYYITCFCGIYTNTQIHLFQDSFISDATSLFIPFLLLLIPGIFRIAALKVKKPIHKYLYKFSLFLDNCFG